MKPFGWKQFKQAGYTIPNSNDRVKIEESIVQQSGNDVTFVSISVDNKLLLEFYRYSWTVSVRFVDPIYAKELGLIHNSDRDGYSSILDGLYYMYNRFEPMSAKGKVYKKTFLALKSRMGDICWLNSIRTQQLMKLCFDTIKTNILRDESIVENSEEYIRKYTLSLIELGLHDRVKICYLSGKVDYYNVFRRYSIHFKIQNVHESVRLEDYKYYDSSVDRTYIKKGFVAYKERVVPQNTEFKTCHSCLNIVPVSLFDTDHECVFCAEKHYQIHTYNTRVPTLLSFKATKVKPKENPLYLGIELEFETTDREAARLKVGKALRGHAIMKSDGSIRHGFEVVTCPATVDIQLDIFKTFYENKPVEITNGPNVGMHVHVSRKPLSLLSIGKLTEFMNRADNKRFIEFIAGRNLNTYCNQSNRSITYPITTDNGGARYNTLNLSNKDTIEFRIFGTPLGYEDFAARLQFVQALVDYSKPCMQASSLKIQTYFESFVNWVCKNNKDYPQLFNKIKGFA